MRWRCRHLRTFANVVVQQHADEQCGRVGREQLVGGRLGGEVQLGHARSLPEGPASRKPDRPRQDGARDR